jgi:hypothetical protein
MRTHLRLKKIPPDMFGDDNYLLGVRIPSPAPFWTKKICLQRTMLFPRTPKCHTKMDRPTYPHTHTHTLQLSIHEECVEQSLFPHTNHKRKTTQTKKANKPKPHSVVCNFTAPHPHTKKKKTLHGRIKKTLGKGVNQSSIKLQHS